MEIGQGQQTNKQTNAPTNQPATLDAKVWPGKKADDRNRQEKYREAVERVQLMAKQYNERRIEENPEEGQYKNGLASKPPASHLDVPPMVSLKKYVRSQQLGRSVIDILSDCEFALVNVMSRGNWGIDRPEGYVSQNCDPLSLNSKWGASEESGRASAKSRRNGPIDLKNAARFRGF